ncbi:MAG: LL-diaminopimelate aminotransferase [Bacteroidales bacterium]|nr:LL-diaminopimelate aminotransferase [Bacteroidales bacterium]MBD5342022.1 LL-diaminopimelate aminotransferase [Bacteroides sp.]MBD5359297.1 LL-diaminopimelate aminotransferase [Bacteroides sp.]MBD5362320.1 LL-diaminopimelate aminotransferase [Bacteroides sp.]
MIKVNDNFGRLAPNYLFSEVARKIRIFQQENPEAHVIKMSIGDVTRPLCPAAVEALHRAADDQGLAETFRGYGPEQGYPFLAEKICQFDYAARGIDISPDEVFISDGAKSDLGNIGDIFSADCTAAITDPVYPVYVDTNVMTGRKIVFLPCTEANGMVPELPTEPVDLIYLCYPNNPTGTTLTRAQLKVWVDYARKVGAVILFDSAYECFITEEDIPHSIYEIEGAKECAIEFRSFSKTAGFTGMRCGYTVIPHALKGVDSMGNEVSLNGLWRRRQTTKFNGASYPIQRAAEAIYTPSGQTQIRESVDYYLHNAAILRQGIGAAGLSFRGGINAPYVWVKTPEGLSSWEFFDLLLAQTHVACTPGVGFGLCGEGYVRLTAFNTLAATEMAMDRISKLTL